jgi:hypothetical protein
MKQCPACYSSGRTSPDPAEGGARPARTREPLEGEPDDDVPF